MATEKQIAANRANAKRSTGPKTAEGKRKSSQNAWRHGLSLSIPADDPRVSDMIQAMSSIARATLSEISAFALTQVDLNRVRQVQLELQLRNNALSDSDVLKRLLATDRYERRALTRRRRSIVSVESLTHLSE